MEHDLPGFNSISNKPEEERQVAPAASYQAGLISIWNVHTLPAFRQPARRANSDLLARVATSDASLIGNLTGPEGAH